MARSKSWFSGICALALLATAAPSLASVRDGVDAWSDGDYQTAVSIWSGPATAGDPDALFNLGQAYRLGRGVARDMAQAQELYRRAAEAGHIRAGDTYGLMLFQSGRYEEALPYITPAARRGDPRAQYLMGVAHFNGRLVERDWEKAYAYLTLANSAGLPQAASAITRMDTHIPLAQRQNAALLAVKMQAEAEQVSAAQFASEGLGVSEMSGPAPNAVTPRVAGQTAPSRAVPQPIETATLAPSTIASSTALREARNTNGTASPADAGASYTQPNQPVGTPVQVAIAPAPRVQAPAPQTAPGIAPASRYAGVWRVQLGAFGVAGNADRLWSQLSSRPELRGSTKLLVPSGRVTKLQAGGFTTRADARAACNALKASGQDCLVTR